jgi:hypothetical protein
MTFNREALLYDISNCAYVEGDTMKAEDIHERHQVIDIIEEGNIDRVTRMLDLAFARCVEACYPYTKVPVTDSPETEEEMKKYEMVTDDTLVEQDYVMRMLVPDDFSQTTITLLTHTIHNLLVARVLADWMSITNPTKKDEWMEKVASLEEEIRHMLNARIGRVRRTQSPF